MTQNSKGVFICVSPEFRKKLKVESSSREKSMIEYSKDLARQKTLLQELEDMETRDEKKRFNFRI